MSTANPYGIRFEDIAAIGHPQEILTPIGPVTICVSNPLYTLTRMHLPVGASVPRHFHRAQWVAYYVEGGRVLLETTNRDGQTTIRAMSSRELSEIAVAQAHCIHAHADSDLYCISGPGMLDDIHPLETAAAAAERWRSVAETPLVASGIPTSDVRGKYWGRIETIVSREVAGKRIEIRAGGQSSLEYHVVKHETYYVHSGEVRVGLRVGRAENRSLVLHAGDVFSVAPGLMHMRIGIRDTVIIEISTRDDDSDSHLVEDGRHYRHVDS